MNLRARYLNKTFTGVPFSLLNTTILAGKFQLLLDRFSGAAAAYSLRALSKDSTNVVKVRRDSDNAERDFTAVEVSNGTLEAWTKGTLSTTAPADYGSGAAAAYSLRIVSDSYTGPVVKVRRSDDNAEADFTAEEVSDGTLLAWVGTTASDNGFVTTWYDQSGNSNDAIQDTATEQPKIVDGGSLVTSFGKPAIEFDGVNDLMIVFDPETESQFTASRFSQVFCVHSATAAGLQTIVQYSGAVELESSRYDTIDDDINFSTSSGLYTVDNLNVKGYLNGVDETGGVTVLTQTFNRLYFGDGATKLSEYIHYPYASDQSANRADIEGDINDYYGIYTPTTNGFVTTWYDQSGNSNDATQSTAASQPKIVDAGVLITENGKAAISWAEARKRLDTTFTGLTEKTVILIGDLTNFFDKQGRGISSYSGSGSPVDEMFLDKQSGDFRLFDGGASLTLAVSGGQGLYWAGRTSTSLTVGFNGGTLITGGTPNSNPNTRNYAIGEDNPFGTSDDEVPNYLQELILYPSDQSANRVLIERNIASYYGITLS